MNDIKIEASWKAVLADAFEQPYFQVLSHYLRQAKAAGKSIYPPGSLVFNAFNTTPFDQVKVVILGQDPYHNPGQAMGLSFSVPPGVPPPRSLKHIYQELAADVGCRAPAHGDLTAWATQGVFLLNAILTVEKNLPGSHRDIGWQKFTDTAIRALSEQRQHLVFILWGAFAQKKKALIDTSKHLVIQSAHPSPLSAHRGFFGSKPFSQANAYLVAHGIAPIDWQL
ncbi:MAG: uracil-DNA glycosylase [Bacteroidetes bacterium]|nr:MAG: uracil-DNA glycosylase [Bacteroidota bacterium]PTM10851.1 MAG: uracil-DNA glycosylase [Bacteroidota bacterium]